MKTSPTALPQKQWLRLHEVILALHAHTELRTYPQVVLAGLHRLLAADTASFSDTRGGLVHLPWQRLPARGAAELPEATGPSARLGAILWTDFQRDFLADREAFIALYTTGPGHSAYTAPADELPARRISDDVSLHAFRASRLYTTCYAPIDREVYCSARLPGGGSVTCAVSRQGLDFSDREVLVLDLLRPHLHLAYQRLLTLAQADAALAGPTSSGVENLRRLGLTAREAEILGWVAEGKTNPEIALILRLSAATVKTHLEHILRKLGCETRTAAARRAVEVLARG
jgi:DNA-binding CsgD family transcriptional regulator